ncbi:hypothetical protein, partial [Pseudomonas viridiflava]
MSIYQSVQIALVDNVLRSLATSPVVVSGGLFAVKLGKLGLGLGAFIAAMSVVGAVGTTWNNWEKWKAALDHGTMGERTGAG